jgi:hypothetical protein
MLTCDRCYDFRHASRAKVRAIFHACASLMNVRDGSTNALPTRQKKLSAAESALQELIAKYVKELTSIYASYFNRPNVVEPAVAEVIFAQPTQALGVILNWRDTFGHLNIAPLKPVQPVETKPVTV